MEPFERTEITPRRSARLQRQRAMTPESSFNEIKHVLGPRELMKLNRSKKLNQSYNIPDIQVIPASPVIKNKKASKSRSKSMTATSVFEDTKESQTQEEPQASGEKNTTVQQEMETKTVEPIEPVKSKAIEPKRTSENNAVQQDMETKTIEPIEPVKSKEIEPKRTSENSAVQQEIESKTVEPIEPVKSKEIQPKRTSERAVQQEMEPKTVVPTNPVEIKGMELNKIENAIPVENQEAKDQPARSIDNDKKLQENEKTVEIVDAVQESLPLGLTNQAEKMSVTKLLMDESVISIPDSPPMTKSTMVVKDATFSPEVDTSIHDSRPHIDVAFTPGFTPQMVTLRTSTPLSQRVLIRETPKISAKVVAAIKKVLSPKVVKNKKLDESNLNDTFNNQVKVVNPLERSILKSTRKRSLSVTDGESFMHKKVVFSSPKIMEISAIDERLLQSFKEEKENSMLKQTMASGGSVRRKRSLSESGTPARAKLIKMPNFKAIHEQQFNKMESISDHLNRKAARAKKLVTPSKTLATVPEVKQTKEADQKSKIPTRKPLNHVNNKTIPKKRSNSVEMPGKVSAITQNKKNDDPKMNLPRLFDFPSHDAPASKLPVVKRTFSASTVSKINPTTSGSSRAKVDERREKNMSLYKNNAVRAGQDLRKKNENVLKGVRLNRRFELQMKHRQMD